MKSSVINGIHTGYVVWTPENSLSELKHAGEEWAFPEYATTIHAHPFHELHLQLSGTTEWQTEDGIVVVEKNMLIGVAPQVRHRMRPLTARAHHFVYCSLDIPGQLALCGLDPVLPIFSQPYFLIRNAEELIAPFTTLSREIRQQRPCRKELIELSTRSIATMLYRFARGESEATRESLPDEVFDSRLLCGVRHYIDQHLNEKLSIPALLATLGISRSALFESIKRELGKSPAAFHAERRMELAKTMLKTPSLPLTQIAYDLGFSSSQHFSSAFRKQVGITPSRYRASYHSQRLNP